MLTRNLFTQANNAKVKAFYNHSESIVDIIFTDSNSISSPLLTNVMLKFLVMLLMDTEYRSTFPYQIFQNNNEVLIQRLCIHYYSSLPAATLDATL